MEINNSFEVKAPIDIAWATLTDLARIAPCLPGATLTSVEGDIYKGHVTVKVGPIIAKFGGQAIFQERDDLLHRAVLKGEGRDSSGKGNASAIITAQLEAIDSNTTRCTVNTVLTITGKIAQFGRGALADVSDKLLKQFVVNLETSVLTQDVASATSTVVATSTASTTSSRVENAPINLFGSSGLLLVMPILKRTLPIVAVVAVIIWLLTK